MTFPSPSDRHLRIPEILTQIWNMYEGKVLLLDAKQIKRHARSYKDDKPSKKSLPWHDNIVAISSPLEFDVWPIYTIAYYRIELYWLEKDLIGAEIQKPEYHVTVSIDGCRASNSTPQRAVFLSIHRRKYNLFHVSGTREHTRLNKVLKTLKYTLRHHLGRTEHGRISSSSIYKKVKNFWRFWYMKILELVEVGTGLPSTNWTINGLPAIRSARIFEGPSVKGNQRRPSNVGIIDLA